MLFCMNLPPELRYKPENVFLVGIIPGPKEPNVLQMNNLLRPLVTELQELWAGKQLNCGDRLLKVRAALVALTCDLPAARKVAGFGSHASTHFCSVCYLRRKDIESLDVDSWERRTLEKHNADTIAWKTAATVKEKDATFVQTGVRWTVLSLLPYWDPTRMLSIDIMHNLSGIIQYHARELMGLELDKILKRRDSPEPSYKVPDEVDSLTRQAELDEAVLELEAGDAESETERYPTIIKATNQPPSISVQEQSMEIESSMEEQPADGDHEECTSSNLPAPPKSSSSRRATLSFSQLLQLRNSISTTVVPTWVDAPPANLGDKRQGKLKGIQWIYLISIYLPLAMVDVYAGDGLKPLCLNLMHLISFVNLTFAKVIRVNQLQHLQHHLSEYLSSCKSLYPNFKMKPNHHNALHLAELAKLMGPPRALAVFAGERINFSLRQTPTNKQPGEPRAGQRSPVRLQLITFNRAYGSYYDMSICSCRTCSGIVSGYLSGISPLGREIEAFAKAIRFR